MSGATVRGTGRWLLPEPPADAALRLFCFSHAGAGASVYRPWVAELAASGVAVCPVQLPGRENRFGEQPFRTLPTLMAALTDALAGYASVPFALFGHSFGALLAYELVRTWRREAGPTPEHLFVSGRIAPHLRDPRDRLHVLPDRELLGHLRSLGGMPAAVLDNAELMTLQLPLLRADLTVNETYVHEARHAAAPRLSVPISAFGGSEDTKVDAEELRAWGAHTSGTFVARFLLGGHFYLQTCRPRLLECVVADLRRTVPTIRLAS